MAEKAKKTKKTQTGKYEEIQRDLEKQKATLLEGAGMISPGLVVNTENLPDVTDQASAETDQYFQLRLREREQKLIKKIDEALERIASGAFGVCERCGGEIAYPRLKARPVTTLCIDCKTKQEEEEKIRAS